MPRKYTLQFAKDAPVDDDFHNFVDELFSELSLTPELAQHAANRWQGYVGKRMERDALAFESDLGRQVDQLKASWGRDYDAHIATAKGAVKSLGLSAKDIDAIERSMGLEPMLNLFARLGRNVTTKAGDGQSKISIATPEEAASDLEALKCNANFQKLLRSPRDPGHAEAVRKWEAAHAAAYPTKEMAPVKEGVSQSTPAKPSTPVNGSPAWAKGEITRLLADRSFQDGMRAGPNRTAAVETWKQLHELAAAPSQGEAQ